MVIYKGEEEEGGPTFGWKYYLFNIIQIRVIVRKRDQKLRSKKEGKEKMGKEKKKTK